MPPREDDDYMDEEGALLIGHLFYRISSFSFFTFLRLIRPLFCIFIPVLFSDRVLYFGYLYGSCCVLFSGRSALSVLFF